MVLINKEERKMARLENWAVITAPVSMFMAPELCSKKLQGKIYDDPRFADGVNVHTSSLEEIDVLKRTARTRNTVYILGEPHPDYAQYCKENNIEL
jgi:hypothetical protein